MSEFIVELTELGIIPANISEVKPLSGGTSSTVTMVRYENNVAYVIKANEPQVIEAESKFFATYEGLKMLPKLIYTDKKYRFIVYTFLSGTMVNAGLAKKDVLAELVQGLINFYEPATTVSGWGWIDEPHNTWQEFLKYRAVAAAGNLGSTLPEEDFKMVLDCIAETEASGKFLLHGDCGYHNFIFDGGSLAGVIDPTPVYGDPLYDLIYAFCSTPDELTMETIESAVEHMHHSKNRGAALHKEVLVGLYFRIGTCVNHHPEDLEKYLIAWEAWKQIVRDEEG